MALKLSPRCSSASTTFDEGERAEAVAARVTLAGDVPVGDVPALDLPLPAAWGPRTGETDGRLERLSDGADARGGGECERCRGERFGGDAVERDVAREAGAPAVASRLLAAWGGGQAVGGDSGE